MVYANGKDDPENLAQKSLNMPRRTGKTENGAEYFFSQTMLKIIQIPHLFTISSEVPKSDTTGAFLVLIFEK